MRTKKTNLTETEEYLRATKLPENTDSYTRIPHGDIIDAVREKLKNHNFKIVQELFTSEDAGEIAYCTVKIECTKDPDMGMIFYWGNSYNKKVRFHCTIGGFIYDNSTSFINSTDNANYLRKHTGTAYQDAFNIIDGMIECADEHFDKIVRMKNKYKNIPLDRKAYAKLMGLLFFDKKIINPNQVSALKQEYDAPTIQYDDKETLWGLYKMIMFALKDTPPKVKFAQQVKISYYLQVLYHYAVEETQYDLEQSYFDDLQREKELLAIKYNNATMPSETNNQNEHTATVEEVVHELYGVDNDIEVSIETKGSDFDLDAEEDDDWDNLQQAGIITPCIGHNAETIKDEKVVAEKLEEIRESLNDESVSYGEIVELQELSEFIEEGDVQLLEAAGVPEFLEVEDNEISSIGKNVITEEQIELLEEEYGILNSAQNQNNEVQDSQDSLFLLDEALSDELQDRIEEEKTLEEDVKEFININYNANVKVNEIKADNNFIGYFLNSHEVFVKEK